MKRFLKMVISMFLVVVILIVVVSGRFYYSVYASEYNCSVTKDSVDVNATNRLRIGTYNVHSLNYGKEDLESFVNDIKDLQLDIICLQEVDQNAIRSGNFDMVASMAKEAGYPYYHFYSTMWILNGYYGIGILSKYQITKVSSQLMANSLFREPRVLTKTVIEYGQTPLNIYNTHVAYDSYHDTQLDFIENNIELDGHVILAGDFNYFYGYNERWDTDILDNVNSDETLMTYGSYGSPDNIYYSDNFELVERNVKTSSFSDHSLLYAKFLIK